MLPFRRPDSIAPPDEDETRPVAHELAGCCIVTAERIHATQAVAELQLLEHRIGKIREAAVEVNLTGELAGAGPQRQDTAATLSLPHFVDFEQRGVIARGLGRSYNESGQNSGGLTVDMTPLTRIYSIDPDTAIADVDAGLSLDALMAAALPFGLWVPVLPGTRQVTADWGIATTPTSAGGRAAWPAVRTAPARPP